MNQDSFIQKAKLIHGDKYDYSKVEYVNYNTKVCIICPIHGEFWQTPTRHLNSLGCLKCAIEVRSSKKRLSFEDFKQKVLKKFGDKFSFEKTIYKNSRTNLVITCKEHGDFIITPHLLLHGLKYGCPKCNQHNKELKLAKQDNVKLTAENDAKQLKFIQKAKLIHDDKYDYSKVEYTNNHTKVCIICPKHGEFWQTPAMHYNERQGCPKCSTLSSHEELEIVDFIKANTNLIVEERNHTVLNGKEIDIYLPEVKIGIEYNGLRWHSEEFQKDKYYHLKKTQLCEQKGIRLIQIFADEWKYKNQIVKSKLLHLICPNNQLPTIFARQCIINEIDDKTAKTFLEINHIQGFHKSSIYLGCFYKNILIGVMTFIIVNKQNKLWELNRFATDINYQCVGVGGKLLSYFKNKYNFNEIKSFADRRWSSTLNNIYIKLGFELVEKTHPDYYYIPKHATYLRIHKFNCRKQILHKKYGFPLSMSENEMTKKLEYYKIWNCGLLKYRLKNQSPTN